MSDIILALVYVYIGGLLFFLGWNTGQSMSYNRSEWGILFAEDAVGSILWPIALPLSLYLWWKEGWI